MSAKKTILWRINLAFGLIVLLGLAIIFQSFRIQVINGERWRSLADSLTTSFRSIEAERGNVYSEDGRLLATSLPFFEVRMDVNTPYLTNDLFYNNVDSLAWHMSRFFKDKSKAEYKKKLILARKTGNRYLLVHRKVTYPELQEMKTWPIFRMGRYKGGMIIIQRNKRVTPFRLLAHRTIGYVRDEVQPVGIEGSFNEYLKGEKGQRLMQKIAGATWMPVNDANEIEPQNGKDVITTIDVNLQDVTQHALLSTLKRHNADHGCAIVMEVKTGKIKAIANLGEVDDGQYWETYNYAVGEGSEPGSTFKLASILALLEDNLVDIYDSIDLEKGEYQFFDKTMKDSEEHDYTKVTVKKAFEISSNVGISKLIYQGYSKQPEMFTKHLYEFLLNEKTGIEIAGESEPLIKNPDNSAWSGTTLPWMSVGYEVKLTPLQILAFYNSIANSGKMMKPYLVSQVQEYGKTLINYDPVVLKEQIASPENIEKVKLLLEGAVEDGTAKNIRSADYKIAGKTGTAQIADDKHGYRQIYQASFVGYFPAEDPLYSCIVVVSTPRSGIYYGSAVAGPVFKEIADKIYANSIKMHGPVNKKGKFYTEENIPYAKAGLKKDAQILYNTLGISCTGLQKGDWVSCVRNDNAVRFKEHVVIEGLIPDVTGMGLRDAVYLLENAGLKVKVEGRGKVRAQSLRPGAKSQAGQTIIIELS